MASPIIARQPVRTRSERWANNLPPPDVDWRQKFISLALEYDQRLEKLRTPTQFRYTYPRPWQCQHPKVETRKREQSNGVIAFYKQCVSCGGNRGAVKKTSIHYDPPWWDKTFELTYQQENQTQLEKSKSRDSEIRALQAWRNRCWWHIYNAYLQSPSWTWRRARVLERDDYLCQGCGIDKATAVHHVSYENVGAELLFELVSICGQCHRKVHRHE